MFLVVHRKQNTYLPAKHNAFLLFPFHDMAKLASSTDEVKLQNIWEKGKWMREERKQLPRRNGLKCMKQKYACVWMRSAFSTK